MLAALSGASVINSIGGMFGELAHHPVQTVIDNDLAGVVERLLRGIEVTEDTLAVDLIDKVGPIPGFYPAEQHTRKYYRSEHFNPKLMDQLAYPAWVRGGRKTCLDYARTRVAELLANYQDTLPPSVHQDLDCILEEARKYYHNKGLA